LAAVGGLDGLKYMSTQKGVAGALPWLVMVTLIVTGSPALKLRLFGSRLILVTTKSGSPGLRTSGKYSC
jgi:hypothetical protein